MNVQIHTNQARRWKSPISHSLTKCGSKEPEVEISTVDPVYFESVGRSFSNRPSIRRSIKGQSTVILYSLCWYYVCMWTVWEIYIRSWVPGFHKKEFRFSTNRSTGLFFSPVIWCEQTECREGFEGLSLTKGWGRKRLCFFFANVQYLVIGQKKKNTKINNSRQRWGLPLSHRTEDSSSLLLKNWISITPFGSIRFSDSKKTPSDSFIDSFIRLRYSLVVIHSCLTRSWMNKTWSSSYVCYGCLDPSDTYTLIPNQRPVWGWWEAMASALLSPAVTSLRVDMTRVKKISITMKYGMYDIQNPNHGLRGSPEIILENAGKPPKHNEAPKYIGLTPAKRSELACCSYLISRNKMNLTWILQAPQ